MRVLLAIEPLSYREVIGEAIQALRPHIGVVVADSGEVGRLVNVAGFELVISGNPNVVAPGELSAWVEFKPYSEPQAKVCIGGRRWELSEVDLEDLLAIVDETESLTRVEPAAEGC